MDRVYVAISATTETERKALKACFVVSMLQFILMFAVILTVVDPMLISDITTVKIMVTIMLLAGTWKRWLTFAIQREKTIPLSLANAKVCRDVEAMQLVLMMSNSISITIVKPVAPPMLPVLCSKTLTMGKPVEADKVVSKSPMQKTYVAKTISATGMLEMKLHHIERGTTTPASRISSAMCAAASDPTTVNIAPTCPTQTVRPMLLQPAPLSVNSVKTVFAVCFWGVMVQSTAMIGIQLTKCKIAKPASMKASHCAKQILKTPMPQTIAIISRVVCQRSGV